MKLKKIQIVKKLDAIEASDKDVVVTKRGLMLRTPVHKIEKKTRTRHVIYRGNHYEYFTHSVKGVPHALLAETGDWVIPDKLPRDHYAGDQPISPKFVPCSYGEADEYVLEGDIKMGKPPKKCKADTYDISDVALAAAIGFAL